MAEHPDHRVLARLRVINLSPTLRLSGGIEIDTRFTVGKRERGVGVAIERRAKPRIVRTKPGVRKFAHRRRVSEHHVLRPATGADLRIQPDIYRSSRRAAHPERISIFSADRRREHVARAPGTESDAPLPFVGELCASIPDPTWIQRGPIDE